MKTFSKIAQKVTVSALIAAIALLTLGSTVSNAGLIKLNPYVVPVQQLQQLGVFKSYSSPTSATVLAGEDDVELLKLYVKAPYSDITINELNVNVKNGDNVLSLSLYNGNELLDTVSVSSYSNSAVFNDLNFTVAEQGYEYLTIKADLASDAVGYLYCYVSSSSRIVAEDNNGNTANVYGNFPIYSGVMHIEQQEEPASLTVSLANTPTVQTYINGSSDLEMTGINMTAGDEKDVYVKSVKLTAIGTNSCATETDCILTVSLWDGDTQVGNTRSLTVTTVTFNNLNVRVDEGTTKKLTAKVDMNTLGAVASGTTLDLSVAAATDVTVQDEDGNTGTVTGTVDGPNHNIASTGTLTATLAPDDAETESQIIEAGEMETLAKYKFTAQDEALKITKVQIKVPVAAVSSISALYLYQGDTMIAGPVSPSSVTGIANFNSFSEDFVIPRDGNNTLTVKAQMNTISGGAVSGTLVIATLDYDTNFEARSAEGTNTVVRSVGNADITGRNMYLRETNMVIDRAATSNTIINGTAHNVYKFTVTAGNNEDIALRQLGFNVTFIDNGVDQLLSADNWKLYKNGSLINAQVDIVNADGTNVEAGNFGEVDVGAGADLYVVFGGLNGEETISQGNTNTYTLSAELTGFTAGAENDAFSVELLSDTAAQTAGYTYIDDVDPTASQYIVNLSDGITHVEATVPNIIWSDNSGVPHDPTIIDNGAGTAVSSADWINGFLVKNTPIGASYMHN